MLTSSPVCLQNLQALYEKAKLMLMGIQTRPVSHVLSASWGIEEIWGRLQINQGEPGSTVQRGAGKYLQLCGAMHVL